MFPCIPFPSQPSRNMDDSEMNDNDNVGIIKPIEQESVRRIVAGQAVTDLASAVKELVDNALDAKSKSVNSKRSPCYHD